MNMIYDHHYLTAAGKIEISEPSRGEGGTLAYPVKIMEQHVTFEMDDEGEWKPFPLSCDLSTAALLQIRMYIDILEKKRLTEIYADNLMRK